MYKEDKDICGYLHKEWFNDHGDLHREDGPAYIRYNPNGSISSQSFCINGHLHREDGPASIQYDSYGNIISESSFLYGQYHRKDGPAEIRRNKVGSIDYEEFWIDGKFLEIDKVGFWMLWGRLTEVERQAPDILKYLARYS